ncbi:amidohydrolase [Herbiconiux daphne]|uniref:Amidohydrolase family protein n=1 Tax=Herbiconiux daphne TaxID=2970914 RepID=A0ABT2GW03_9MICO|nr:amidohydrolase [Herbiconiux daphne]MCS5732152.1 amidohydrolase family protein [Herbiconiux daphne]
MTREMLFVGTVITADAAQPRAEALLVRDGRIAAVGGRAAVQAEASSDAAVVELGDRALLPGFIEAHGHPSDSAVVLSRHFVDIRPVTLETADDVMRAIRDGVRDHPDGAYFNGWDGLLQTGLADPTIAELDAIGGDTPLVILHNSGHVVYFNSAAARQAGVDASTPDPAGAHWQKDAAGALTGKGFEVGTVFALLGPTLTTAAHELPELLPAYLRSLNAVGITTVSDMSWDAAKQPALDAARAAAPLTARLRLYEMSAPGRTASVPLENGDDVVKQVGVKTWADGSPWVGNILISFPYLDTDGTRSIGVAPGSHGSANYSREQLDEVVERYFPDGWQLACHVHGDLAVDRVLDSWQALLERHPRSDHRLRMEHVGAMSPAQFERAAALGATVSLLIDHVYYWGEVLVDELFGPEHGGPWANARAALDAGLTISFHNDGTVTPAEPLRNMAVGMTRTTRAGRHIAGAEGVTFDEALRAQTLGAAWQLFAENEVGSLEVGKYADLVVLSADPASVPPDQLPALEVLETYLEGRRVYRRDDASGA